MAANLLCASGDTFHYDKLAAFAASLDAATFASDHFNGVARFQSDEALLRNSVASANINGLFLEFGVASGRTLRFIAEEYQGQIYGFDSFNGLPENWREGYDLGAFAQRPPETLPNAELVVGLFDRTLPSFMVRHREPVSFLHIDCDLYSSTVTILEALKNSIIPGTIIVFDEFLNYPGWRQHEFKAWTEFSIKYNFKFKYTGVVPSHQQVRIEIL
ncbi:MAG: class I SAM-dependent methyltransferase [Acidocella sp.]|nr:class I SAM-dependent methyltransferase [Acidocella sp.]MDE8349906.1 class I SAM-dependent methyltransferase [Acidocella sp.]